MPARPTKGAEKASVAAPVVIGVIVILVLFVGFLAYRNFAPSGPTPTKTATSDWLEKLARESGGDIHKLSPADQAKLNSLPMGGGAQWLKRKYDSLH